MKHERSESRKNRAARIRRARRARRAAAFFEAEQLELFRDLAALSAGAGSSTVPGPAYGFDAR